MLPCSCYYEILELSHTFTRFVSYIYIVLSFMLKFITDEENSYV